MMHRAWSSIVEVPYCFSRPHIKFQGHTALKIVKFDPNWAFPDSNSSLNSPMAMKCCTKLETAKERCPIVFQGHPSNFKVTRDKTSPILTQIGRFRTVTPVWIHQWLWNVARSLKQQRRDALLFSKVIHQIFKVTRYKASPTLTQIRRFRTIGGLQLSNPSDLPCFFTFSTISTELLLFYVTVHLPTKTTERCDSMLYFIWIFWTITIYICKKISLVMLFLLW